LTCLLRAAYAPDFSYKEALLDIKQIKTLIDLMKKNDLTVFKMEQEDFKITLKKETGYAPVVSAPPQALAPSAPVPADTVEPSTPAAKGREIVSPMVGTFYSAPSPESPPFVEVGQKVTSDTVVCIIEAMKVMSEIKAEMSGTVTEVLVENGKPVQFGQALFRVE
jgi:acetyl-CoA carboxylase biotin carboxyl carrier protein